MLTDQGWPKRRKTQKFLTEEEKLVRKLTRNQYFRDYHKRKHDEQKLKGLCINCSEKLAEKSVTFCQRHLAENAKASAEFRARHKSFRLCVHCSENVCIYSFTMCLKCLDRHREDCTKTRKKKKENLAKCAITQNSKESII